MSYQETLFKPWSEGGHRPPEKCQIGAIKIEIVVIGGYGNTTNSDQMETKGKFETNHAKKYIIYSGEADTRAS